MKYFSLCLVLLFTLTACHGDGDNHSPNDTAPQLELALSEAPIELPGIAAEFAADVPYGEEERQLFDIYLPDSDEPTPLVVYFHGGAYVGGDKSFAHENHADDIREFLQAGIAFATANYYLLSIEEPLDDDGVIHQLTDGGRVVQFLRYHASSLNIDPEQVAVYGVSAGASTSLWLGTHDDLADPENEDPVLRESTRVNAVGALFTQATLDFIAWESILNPVVQPLAALLGGTDIPTAASTLGQANLLLTALGLDSFDELESDENIAYRANIDTLGLMDAGDAPIYAFNDNTVFAGSGSFEDLVALFLHHTLHVLALHDRAQQVGLENVMYAIDPDPDYALEDPSGEGHVSFLIRHLR